VLNSWRIFIYLFTGESEFFVATILLVIFGTVIATSQSLNQFFGTYVYFSRMVFAIFISMAISGLAIQISTIKRLSDDYVGYVFSVISAVSNSFALALEIFEMMIYGASWLGIELFGNQQISYNSFLSTLGFVIFGFSVLVNTFSILDLLDISFGEKK